MVSGQWRPNGFVATSVQVTSQGQKHLGAVLESCPFGEHCAPEQVKECTVEWEQQSHSGYVLRSAIMCLHGFWSATHRPASPLSGDIIDLSSAEGRVPIEDWTFLFRCAWLAYYYITLLSHVSSLCQAVCMLAYVWITVNKRLYTVLIAVVLKAGSYIRRGLLPTSASIWRTHYAREEELWRKPSLCQRFTSAFTGSPAQVTLWDSS